MDGSDYICTGFMYFKATPDTTRLCLDWTASLLKKWGWNQPRFNQIMRARRDVHFCPLDSVLFPSGQRFFGETPNGQPIQDGLTPTQRQHSRVVHNNFIGGHDAKRRRFEAAGLWSPGATQEDESKEQGNGEADGCALLFFGLPKQFRSTVLPSIRTHILASNTACAVYAHTYNVSKVTTKRNEEHAAPIFAAEVRALTSNVTMDSMDAFPHDLAWFRRYDRIWKRAESMDNMIKQWHSIERVWGSMLEAERRRGREYARVGLFRLDVVYKTDIRLDDGAHAVIPNFGHWYNDPKRGLNDRMFYGDRAYGEQWATGRFSQVEAYVASHANALHSESFMLYLMRDVPVTLKQICFHRVRANGKVQTNDC